MKPPSLAVIMAPHHGAMHDEPDGDEPEADEGDGEGMQAASEAAIDAVHAKDPEAFAKAVGALCRMHYEKMDEEGDGEDEEEDDEE